MGIFATPQMPNSLFYDGKEYPIDNDPMWEYFEKHPEQRPRFEGRMSALWRGYLAFFEFRGKDLFLKDLKTYGGMEIRGEYGYDRWKSVIKESLGDEIGLKVDWFSGLLVSRYGENDYLDAYDIFEHQMHYSNYAIFEVESGILKNHRFFDNKGFLKFLKQQFEEFKKTPEFSETVRKLSENGRTQKNSEAIIEESILNYSKKMLAK
jgi:hypothetical protein